MDTFIHFIICTHNADMFTWNIHLENVARKHIEFPWALTSTRVRIEFKKACLILQILLIMCLIDASSTLTVQNETSPEPERLTAISLRKSFGFWKRDRFWHNYPTVQKYHNFTLQTMKQPYHTEQPSAVRCAPLSPVSVIVQVFLLHIHWP